MKSFVKYRWRLINIRFYQRTSDVYMARQFCNPKQTTSTSFENDFAIFINSKFKESMRSAFHSHEKQARFKHIRLIEILFFV